MQSAVIMKLHADAEVHAIVNFFRSNKKLPSAISKDPVEQELHKILFRYKQKFEETGKPVFDDDHMARFKTYGMLDEINRFLGISSAVEKKLHKYLNWINSQELDSVSFGSSEFNKFRNFLRSRHLDTCRITDQQRQICANAGFPLLLSQKFKDFELKEYLLSTQLVKWYQKNNRLPLLSSTNRTEYFYAKYLDNTNEICPVARKILKDAGIVNTAVPSQDSLVGDFDALKKELEEVKSQLKQVLERLDAQPKKIKTNGVYLIPNKKHQKICPESELIGLMRYKTNAGKEMLLGIENHIKYPTGNIKYLCRMLNEKNQYCKVIQIWNTCKGIQDLEMFTEKKTV